MPLDYRIIMSDTAGPLVDPNRLAVQAEQAKQEQLQTAQQRAMNPMLQREAGLRTTGLGLENRTRELRNQQLESDRASMDAYTKALADSDGDPDKLEAAWRLAPLTPEHRATADAHLAQVRERKAKMTQEQSALEKAHVDEFGQGMRSIRALPDDQRLGAWQALIDKASSTKDPVTGSPYITPGQVDRDTVPSNDQLIAIERVLRGSTAFNNADKTEQEAKDAAAKRGDEQDTRIAKRRAMELQNAKDQDSWDAGLKSLEELGPEYVKGLPKEFSDHSRQIVVGRAITPEKAAEIADKAADNARQEKTASETERHDRAMEAAAMIRANKSGSAKGGGAISDADKRLYLRDLSSLKEEEEKIGQTRTSLENAIATKQVYVKENGESVPMAQASRDERTTADALVSRMQLRYRDLSNKMKRVVEDKNTFGQALGAEISVPTAKVHEAIDADNQRVIPDLVKKKSTSTPGAGGSGAGTPAAKPVAQPNAVTPPATPKVASVQQMKAYAAKYKLTEEKARQAFKDQGFTIQ